METDLIERSTYSLKVGEKLLDGFTVESEWEGFRKLTSPTHGVVILATNDKPLDGIADAMLGIRKDDRSKRVIVIKASPDILVALDRAHKHVDAKVASPVATTDLSACIANLERFRASVDYYGGDSHTNFSAWPVMTVEVGGEWIKATDVYEILTGEKHKAVTPEMWKSLVVSPPVQCG